MNLIPLKINLYEANTSVAPLYQYYTHIQVHNTKKFILLVYDDKRIYKEGKPQNIINFEKELTVHQFEQLWISLLKNDVLHLTKNILDEDRKKRRGITINYFELIFSDGAKYQKLGFSYTLQQLNQPEFKQHRQIIEIIKNLNKYK